MQKPNREKLLQPSLGWMSELKSQVSLSLTMYHPHTSQQHTQFHRKNNNWIQMMSRFSNRKPSIAASSQHSTVYNSLSLLPQRMCASHTHTHSSRLHNKYLYNKIALHFYSIFFFVWLAQTRIFFVQFLQNLSFAFGIFDEPTNERLSCGVSWIRHYYWFCYCWVVWWWLWLLLMLLYNFNYIKHFMYKCTNSSVITQQ